MILSPSRDGLHTVVLPDAEGNVRHYRASFEPCSPDVWRVVLERVEPDRSGEVPTYRVSLDKRGRFRCSCESFLFSKPDAKTCKHAALAEELHALYAAVLAAQPQKTQPSRELVAAEEDFLRPKTLAF